ncbi:MAG: methyltransferase domain-containing protein [Candidatus Blackburnbacteria bacterium]|nr:methyltransferase domain-containing protein [Candidatus Blackburnbacteria bacterium]
MNLTYPKHHNVRDGHQTSCQICNSGKLHLILDLGHQPLCDTLLTKDALNQPEKTYPLRMLWCQKCTCVQLDYCVPGSVVYHPGYPYRSGITKELAQYQKNISKSLIKRYNLGPSDLVLDVGSNDGTLLSGFKNNGIRVLGIEPTNIAKIAIEQGIDTVQAFFDIKLAKKIKRKYGEASIIITTNTFAHMQGIGEFIMGAYNLLKKDGVFINETHYLLDVIAGGQFDTIYHEHLRTYSLKAYLKLFEQYDFTVTDAERGDRYGGNIRVYATKGKGRIVNSSVKQLLKLEKEHGLDKLSTYEKFATRVKKARIKFMDFLIRAKKAGKSVVGDTCPARASTLLNYYGVGRELLPYITEQPTSLKLNMYLPGEHIPIVENARLIKEQPDYVVIFAWHYAKPIMERLKARSLKSDFIIPLPDFRIVKNGEV